MYHRPGADSTDKLHVLIINPFIHSVIYQFITVLNPQNQRSISKSARSVTWKCLQSLNVHAMRIFLILYYTTFRNQYDEYTVEFMTQIYIRILFGNFPRTH